MKRTLLEMAEESKFKTQRFASLFYTHCTREDLGCVSDLFFECKPNNIEEWADFYFMYGRDLGELHDLAIKVKEETLSDEDAEDIFLYYIWEVIINTFNGFTKELDIMRMIENSGFTCHHADGKLDTELGVDIIVDNVCFLQIKPETFLFGNRNASLINDRRLALKKAEKALREYNLPTFYIFYNKTTGRLKTTNNKICHDLSTLVMPNGAVK